MEAQGSKKEAMKAKDYKICPALFNAYIAKVSKRNPNIMLEDRRIITENEIYNLIQWKLKRFCIENQSDKLIVSVDNKPIFEIKAKGELLKEIKKLIEKESDGDKE